MTSLMEIMTSLTETMTSLIQTARHRVASVTVGYSRPFERSSIFNKQDQKASIPGDLEKWQFWRVASDEHTHARTQTPSPPSPPPPPPHTDRNTRARAGGVVGIGDGGGGWGLGGLKEKRSINLTTLSPKSCQPASANQRQPTNAG